MAKKRHHSSHKKMDRMHESMGMKKHMKHMHKDRMHESEGMMNHERMMHKAHHSSMNHYRSEEMYAGKEMRDRMEYDSSMMIHEDKSAIANLPQQVVMKRYPAVPYAMGYVPDTIMGVDHQMREDSKYQKSGEYPEKY